MALPRKTNCNPSKPRLQLRYEQDNTFQMYAQSRQSENVPLYANTPKSQNANPFCINAVNATKKPVQQQYYSQFSNTDSIPSSTDSMLPLVESQLSQCYPSQSQHNLINSSQEPLCTPQDQPIATKSTFELKEDLYNARNSNRKKSKNFTFEGNVEPSKSFSNNNNFSTPLNTYVNENTNPFLMPPIPSNVNPFILSQRNSDLNNSTHSTKSLNSSFIANSTLTRDFDLLETRSGKGNFGNIFKVRSKVDGVVYAVKKLRRKITSTSISKCRMMNEVYALSALARYGACPFIIQYFRSWIEDDNELFIQTEYCDNGTLSDLINKHIQTKTYFNQYEIVRLIYSIAIALRFIHNINIVHLDIKPDNILLSKNNNYKLCDFGLACNKNISSSQGIIDGDGRYVAMELLNDNVDNLDKADIFSLGLTILQYCLLMESLPSAGIRYQQFRSGDVASLLNGNIVNMKLQYLINSMVSVSPASRPSASQIIEYIDSELKEYKT